MELQVHAWIIKGNAYSKLPVDSSIDEIDPYFDIKRLFQGIEILYSIASIDYTSSIKVKLSK